MYKPLNMPSPLPSQVDPDTLVTIAALTSDIAMVVDTDGRILALGIGNNELAAHPIARDVSKKLRECVTVESVDKIDGMLAQAMEDRTSSDVQVNHAAEGQTDLPVQYRAAVIPDSGYILVTGTELSKQMAMQQQLVRGQLELERSAQAFQEREKQYRSIFQIIKSPLMMVEGKDTKISDANVSACDFFGKPREAMLRATLKSLFGRPLGGDLETTIADVLNHGDRAQVPFSLPATGEEGQVTITPFRHHGKTIILLSIDDKVDNRFDGTGARQTIAHDLDLVPMAAVTMDAVGSVENANGLFQDLVHIASKKKIVGHSIENWLGASALDIKLIFEKLQDNGSVGGFFNGYLRQLGWRDQCPAQCVVSGRWIGVFGSVSRRTSCVTFHNIEYRFAS